MTQSWCHETFWRGGTSKQLVNLHPPPSESLADLACWIRLRRNVTAEGEGYGWGLERKKKGMVPGCRRVKTLARRPIGDIATSHLEHTLVTIFRNSAATHFANWKMSKTNFSILIPFGFSGLMSWPWSSTNGIFFWATWCCSWGSYFLVINKRFCIQTSFLVELVKSVQVNRRNLTAQRLAGKRS